MPPTMSAEAHTTHASVVDKETITMLRTVHQRQVSLNSLADQKANVLLSVVSIVLSIVLTKLDFSLFDTFARLLLLLLFVGFEIVGVIMGLLVVFPRLVFRRSGTSVEALSNPLFFGEFSALPQDVFVAYVMNEIQSAKRTYELLLVDIYQAGIGLSWKYRHLRFAYLATVLGAVPGLILAVKTVVSGG